MIFRSTLIMNSKKQILVLFLAFAALLLLADTAGAEELHEGLGKKQHGVSQKKFYLQSIFFDFRIVQRGPRDHQGQASASGATENI